MRGFVERVVDGRIEGWVVDEENPEAELSLRVFFDDQEVTQGFVTRMRPDVIAAGYAKGASGFSIPFSIFHHRHMPGMVRVVEARTGWPLLPGPIRFEPDPANPVALPLAELEPRIARRISQIDAREALDADLAALIRQLDHAVARARSLAEIEGGERDAVRSAILEYSTLGGALGQFAAIVNERYPQIDFPPAEHPEVSIIVPVRDKFELTYNCLNSIYRIPQKATFEIVLVDDLSSDETLLAALVFSGAVRILRNSRNLGFVGACNAGAAAARGRHLLFLNNDTITSGEWLDALVKTATDPRVGVVGSRLLNRDFSLQECGGIVWNDGTAWNYGRGADPSHPDYRYLRDADYVSGASLMIRADLFRELGGFDTLYAPAYYEDADLCFRVRAAGYAVRVQPGSTIVHLEGRSNGTDVASGLKRFQAVNTTKFMRRWRSVLKTHGDPGVNPQKDSQRGVRKRALFIDDSVPTPDRDAGSTNAIAHMRALMRLGYHVVFVPSDNMADIPPYTARLEQEGVECVYAPYYWSLEDWLRRREPEIDLVYIHRFSNANAFMALVRRFCPSALVVYNVADLHSLRQQRERALGGRTSEQRRVSEGREMELISAADLAIVPSSFELAYARERAPGANLHCIAWPQETAEPTPGFAARTGLGFVGGYRHTPNIDAMEYYAAEINPQLQELQPGLSLEMAGSDLPENLQRLESETLHAIGHVDDLNGFLTRLKATVAPLRWGAGLKGKVLSSFAAGTPCVMTSVAAEGMDLPETLKTYVVDEPGAIALALHKLTNDEQAWADASAAGLEFIRTRYSRERIEGLLKAAIASALVGRRAVADSAGD